MKLHINFEYNDTFLFLKIGISQTVNFHYERYLKINVLELHKLKKKLLLY